MKKWIVLAVLAAFISSCKKEYHCDATLDGDVVDLHCEKCSKSEAEDFEKELEEQGYTDVSCKTE